MKAERRHELQANTLAGFLENIPYYLKVHGNKLLTGAIIVLLLIAFVRWRNAKAVEQQQTIANSLSLARQSVGALASMNLGMLDGNREIITQRDNFATEANNAIDTVASETEDPTIRAEALLTKGNLYWTLANMPDPPGAATQPSLKYPRSREELLADAEKYYGNVITTYPDQKMAKVAALFGLAAVAENRRDFDKAAERYKQIISDDTLKMYKDHAERRLKLLDDLKDPLFLGTLHPEAATQPATDSATQPASQPTTQPVPQATTQLAAQPTTPPSTQPQASPTTQPAPQP